MQSEKLSNLNLLLKNSVNELPYEDDGPTGYEVDE